MPESQALCESSRRKNAMDCPKCGKRQVRDLLGYYRCGVLLHERHYTTVERLHRQIKASRG